MRLATPPTYRQFRIGHVVEDYRLKLRWLLETVGERNDTGF